jgi:hypothetical protein
MIFGDCPHCGHPCQFSVGSLSLPMFHKTTCEGCGQIFYEYLSRIEPRAYKPDQLIVDEENHTIKIKEIK